MSQQLGIMPSPENMRRHEHTLRFLTEGLPPPARILDLGVDNPLADIMREAGYKVYNTRGEDLDEHADTVSAFDVEAVTAFEILEHLVGPLNVLRKITAPHLFATVPLRLWFAKAYRHPRDPWDRHFHEFEDWQFDWLLEKAGWQVKRRKKWTSPPQNIRGLRPILRRFTPRYYAVEAVRT